MSIQVFTHILLLHTFIHFICGATGKNSNSEMLHTDINH